MNINYRPANKHDLEALTRLGISLNKFNLAHDLKENLFWEGWEKEIPEETVEELGSRHNLIFIAETDDKKAIGYILVRKCEICHHYEVDQLYVEDEFRSQKVGKELMHLAIIEAKKAGMPIELEVYTTNTRAINFYKNLGFEESGLIMKLDFDK